MIVFISGPISRRRFYRSRFWMVERLLRASGYNVLNPTILQKWLSHEDAMHICYAMIDCADMVVQLRDWEQSLGATMEGTYAKSKGIPVVGIGDLLYGNRPKRIK